VRSHFLSIHSGIAMGGKSNLGGRLLAILDQPASGEKLTFIGRAAGGAAMRRLIAPIAIMKARAAGEEAGGAAKSSPQEPPIAFCMSATME